MSPKSPTSPVNPGYRPKRRVHQTGHGLADVEALVSPKMNYGTGSQEAARQMLHSLQVLSEDNGIYFCKIWSRDTFVWQES